MTPTSRGVHWNRRVDIDVTTLDALIREYGVPAFVKLDVEGSEPAALAGLSTVRSGARVRVSAARARSASTACVARLGRSIDYVYNWSRGETYSLAAPSWLSDREIAAALRSSEARRRSGDVYARIAGPSNRSI